MESRQLSENGNKVVLVLIICLLLCFPHLYRYGTVNRVRVNDDSYFSSFSSDVPLKSISSCFQLNLGDTAREEVDLEG